MKLQFNKETMKDLGNAGLKIGKSIIVEGTKAVLVKGTVAVITTSFEEGANGVKSLTLDKMLGNDKKKETKSLFKRKKKVEVEIVDVEELVNEAIVESDKTEGV